MAESDCCRGCGDKRPSDAPSGLCPTCLLKAGFIGAGSELPEMSITFGPASSSVLASFGEAFGNIPPILLRDADSVTDPGPVIRPSSPEIPDPADRSARLQLFGEIARGGMGAVLKGRDSDLGRDLAVKILLESHRDKPDMIRRFIEEAQIAGQLQHPGIVPIYELGAFGDRRPYFAMKLVKGHTLAEILANRKTPSEGLPRFLSIFESICQTMAYAHARGVIHRDLKPSNVMVGSFGEVQVMDWGLAKVLPRGGAVEDASAGHTRDQGTVIATTRSGSDSELSQAGSIMGTPSYMAPEQARGEGDQVDDRADVFALGSILCELLTGQPAFTGRTSGEIQRKAARGELADALARLNEEGRGHDPELISLAKSCLASERDDRLRNAGEVAERMSLYHSRVQDRLRQSEIARAEEKARAEEATKRASVERDRFRLTVALAVSVLGLIVLGGGGSAYFAPQRAARLAATERVVTESIDKATLLRGQAKAAPVGDLSKWSDALAAANQARSSLDAGEPSRALQARVVQLLATLEQEKTDAADRAAEAVRDRNFLELLESIRTKLGEQNGPDKLDSEYAKEARRLFTIDSEYAVAFRGFGIDPDHLDPKEAGRLFRSRSEPLEIAFFLDDWTLIRRTSLGESGKDSWRRLIATARATDPDPRRDELRVLIDGGKHEAVRRLAADQKALEAQPAKSFYLLARALKLSWNGDHGGYPEESVEILKRAWRLSPDDYQIASTLGRACERETDKIRFCTAAVTAKPKSARSRSSLARAFFLPRAVDPYSFTWTSITIPPGIEKPLSDPGYTPRWGLKTKNNGTILMGPTWGFDPNLVKAENLRDAIAEYKEALRLDPSNTNDHRDYADALILQGNIDQAITEFREISRLNPKISWLHEYAAQRFYLKGRLDLAIVEWQEAIRLNPKSDGHYIHLLLGFAYHELAEKRLAFAAYRGALLADRSYSFGEVLRLALEATGTPEDVVAAYRDAIRVKPKNPDLHVGLAEVLRAHEHRDAAIVELQEAIRLDPESNWRDTHLIRGNIYREMGKNRLAFDAYRGALLTQTRDGGILMLALETTGTSEEVVAA
jgi:eukaryotic-like serine/threonine-protein kinase